MQNPMEYDPPLVTVEISPQETAILLAGLRMLRRYLEMQDQVEPDLNGADFVDAANQAYEAFVVKEGFGINCDQAYEKGVSLAEATEEIQETLASLAERIRYPYGQLTAS